MVGTFRKALKNKTVLIIMTTAKNLVVPRSLIQVMVFWSLPFLWSQKVGGEIEKVGGGTT